MKEQPPLYNEFLNNIGTKTIIYRERVNYVSVFLETSKWQGCNFYFSQCDEIKPFASLDDDLLIFNSFIEDVENYTETIVVFS